MWHNQQARRISQIEHKQTRKVNQQTIKDSRQHNIYIAFVAHSPTNAFFYMAGEQQIPSSEDQNEVFQKSVQLVGAQ